MSHPENAYAFNEHSLTCCSQQSHLDELFTVLELARAWLLHTPQPLVERVRADSDFSEVVKAGRGHDRVVTLLASAQRRARVAVVSDLQWEGVEARGLSAARDMGGWAVSWPCSCSSFSDLHVLAVSAENGADVDIRHIASTDHVLKHWQTGASAANRRLGRPKSVDRVDSAANGARGEVPHIHFVDGSALNIDGEWKHGERRLSRAERTWLLKVGWVLPVD